MFCLTLRKITLYQERQFLMAGMIRISYSYTVKHLEKKKYKRKYDFDAMLSHIFPWQSWPQGRDVDNQSDSTYLSKIPHSLKKKLDGILFSHDGAHPHPNEALL